MSVNNTGFIIKDGVRVIDSSVGALTVQGDINLGANKLSTTNLWLYESAATTFSILNHGGSARDFTVRGVIFSGSLESSVDATIIQARNTDANYLKFLARDSGVGVAEVARIQGAADPYFKATLGCVMGSFATGAEPGTPVVGMTIYDSTANIMKYWNGTIWKPTSTI